MNLINLIAEFFKQEHPNTLRQHFYITYCKDDPLCYGSIRCKCSGILWGFVDLETNSVVINGRSSYHAQKFYATSPDFFIDIMLELEHFHQSIAGRIPVFK